ncbi:hypothetical protein [Thiolapillus sp.]
MHDLEWKIASYLQDCRDLAGLANGGSCWHADSIVFDILETRAREVIIAVRFIEVLQKTPESGVEQIDRYGRLRLELDEFGDISFAYVC